MRASLAYGMPVRELQEVLTVDDFNELCVYYNMEPWGSELHELCAGVIAATVANCAPHKRKSKTFKPLDFMPLQRLKKQVKQSVKEMQARLLHWFAMTGTQYEEK